MPRCVVVVWPRRDVRLVRIVLNVAKDVSRLGRHGEEEGGDWERTGY